MRIKFDANTYGNFDVFFSLKKNFVWVGVIFHDSRCCSTEHIIFLEILALFGEGPSPESREHSKTDGLGSRRLLRIQPPIHTEELRYTWPDFVCRLPSGRHPLYLWNRHCRSLCRFLCRHSLLAEKNMTNSLW